MMRSQLNDAALRPARNRPFATRSTQAGANPTGTGPTSAGVMTTRIEIGLTPEEEHICDRATD